MSMSFGKMNTFITIVEKQFTQDDEGFKTETDVTVAEVRAYREGRHGSEKWANMASFSTATDLFQFRVIPGVTVTTDMRILCDGHTFEITSVEDVKGGPRKAAWLFGERTNTGMNELSCLHGSERYGGCDDDG